MTANGNGTNGNGKGRGLTLKQKVWLEEYLQCWNKTEAARRAGYKRPRQSGYNNGTKAYIQEEIHRRLSAKCMGADEVLMRLAGQARVDIAGFFKQSEDGKAIVVDWDKIMGEKGHLIRSITFGAHGPKIEVYSAQNALAHLAKHHGLLVDKVQVDANVNTGRLTDAERSRAMAELAARVQAAGGSDTDGSGSVVAESGPTE